RSVTRGCTRQIWNNPNWSYTKTFDMYSLTVACPTSRNHCHGSARGTGIAQISIQVLQRGRKIVKIRQALHARTHFAADRTEIFLVGENPRGDKHQEFGSRTGPGTAPEHIANYRDVFQVGQAGL